MFGDPLAVIEEKLILDEVLRSEEIRTSIPHVDLAWKILFP